MHFKGAINRKKMKVSPITQGFDSLLTWQLLPVLLDSVCGGLLLGDHSDLDFP